MSIKAKVGDKVCTVAGCDGRAFMCGQFCLDHLPEGYLEDRGEDPDINYSNERRIAGATLDTLAAIFDSRDPALAPLAERELIKRGVISSSPAGASI